MSECWQTPTQNMLQHGQAVHDAYIALVTDIPEHLNWLNPTPPEKLRQYHLYHDCGKHHALTIEDGKRRYPNHAECSYRQYLEIFPDDTFSAELVLHDMDFHTMKGAELIELCKQPYAKDLYLTAWAELEANSKMFGGHETESYKIKRSRLIQAGKKLKAIIL